MTDISQEELTAFVDGQLDPIRHIAVEAWLGNNPRAAAAVMVDMRMRDELRLAMSLDGYRRPSDALDAQRVRRRITMARALPPLGLVASVALAVWLTLGPYGIHESIAAPPPPAFIEGALAARDASVLRLAMISQTEILHIDPTEIRAMTGIIIPDVPPEWTMRDIQIFPSPDGPGIEMVFDTPLHGRMSLFIFRLLDDPIAAGSIQHEKLAVAWFRKNTVIHVLSGSGPVHQLELTAQSLAKSLS